MPNQNKAPTPELLAQQLDATAQMLGLELDDHSKAEVAKVLLSMRDMSAQVFAVELTSAEQALASVFRP